MQNEEKKISEATLEEVEFSAEFQKEIAMSYEEVPAELYPSVMAKIEIEKKRRRAKLIRRLGSAGAAVFVFALATVFIFPRVMGGMISDDFSPNEAAYNKGKAIEEADAVSPYAEAPAEPERGDVMLCRIETGNIPEINGEKREHAEYQCSRLLVVKDGNRYFVSDIITGEKVFLSVFVADIRRAESYLCSKYNKEITLTESNDFCFAPAGIQIMGEYIFPWSMIPDEIFVKYAFDKAPEIIAYLNDSDYKIIEIRETQD